MKAVTYQNYGSPDVLGFEDVAVPIPEDDEVLVRVYATTVTTAEGMMRRGEPRIGRLYLGLCKPRKKFRILGLEFSGVIEAVGRNVQRFKKGDAVFGFTGTRVSACAEYVCMPESGSLKKKPAKIPHEEAAACVDGATTALHFLRDIGKIHQGQKLLIIGASGSIGTYAIQLGKLFGAHVTGVCSGANLELVQSLGADKVVDYTKEDYAKLDETYDIVFDAVGKSSFSRCKNILKPNGRYLVTVMGIRPILQTVWTKFAGKQKVHFSMSVEKNELLNTIVEYIQADKLRPVVDRRYRFEQAVEAHRYVDSGRKRGNVVILIR